MAEIHRMTFVCDEMSSLMFRNLYEQKKCSRFCDITINVNNKIVRAHRNVLASSSPYFNSILKHHSAIREHLTVTCFDSEIFNVVINYMYTGHITIENSNVEEILRLCDHLMITKVVDYCMEFLGANLKLDNCLFTYNLSQRFKLKHLCNIVENWIVNHVNEVCDGKEILNLSLADLQDFLRKQNLNLPVFKALNVVSEWVLKNLRQKEKECSKLLSCVQWNNYEPVDIFRVLESCNLFAKNELSFYYLLNALFQNNLLLPSFRNKFDELHMKHGQTTSSEEKENDIEKLDEKDEKDKIKLDKKIIIIKAKQRNQKQRLLKRLLFCNMNPSLKMFLYKNHKLFFNDCDKSATSEDSETKKTSIKCPICFTSINDSLLLEQHLALSHAKDVTYKCGICTFVCQYHGDYLNHMKNHFPGPPFKCDYCDSTTDQISKLISHRSKHLEEAAFQCTFCSFKCRLKQNFVSHLKIHAPEKQFKCDSCIKTFRYKHNLESHKLTHSADKMLTCDSCGFHTKFLSHMIAHKRIHAGDIFRCSYPHCKYSTSKKNQLLSHAKTHNGVRPHSCGICGRGFMEKSHLVRHERIHLEEKPFKCSNCDYASSRRDKLKEHFTRHHGENASAKVPYKARPMRNCGSKPKAQTSQETPASTNTNGLNFTQTNTTSTANISQPIGNELQDLIMHHQNHATSTASNITGINTNYHHFGEPTDFHHPSHPHNIQHQLLASTHNQRTTQHQSTTVNHHMLTRTNHSTATSTAAAVAAAMMLDPRFHHNSTVPYHSAGTPASMAMAAAVQSTQQMQNSTSTPHAEYPATLQNCMTLF